MSYPKNRWEKDDTPKSERKARKKEQFLFRMEHSRSPFARRLFLLRKFVVDNKYVIIAVVVLLGGICRYPIFINTTIPTGKLENGTFYTDSCHIHGVIWKHAFAEDIYVGSLEASDYSVKITAKVYKKPAGWGYTGFRPVEITKGSQPKTTDNDYRYWSNAYIKSGFSEIILLGHDTYIAGPCNNQEEYDQFIVVKNDITKSVPKTGR